MGDKGTMNKLNSNDGLDAPTSLAQNTLTEQSQPDRPVTGDDSVKWHTPSQPTSAASNEDDESMRKISWWRGSPRGLDDDAETDWWFASTAIPLLAATFAPLANLLSIAALVTAWRVDLLDSDGNILPQLQGVPYEDPRWCYWLNVGSLICGFIGNLFLLFNFTGFVRYIIALPVTVVMFYIATGILTGITAGMQTYAPPDFSTETYSQGFWYAVFAAIVYCICSMLLMVNMLGYFLGHYPQRFNLSEHQRTLIIQTMLFFVWLAGGGAVFSKIETDLDVPDVRDWEFVDGMYFCDVTILTVGFGDLYPHDDFARGLVFPYSVGGIIMLGLVISSLHKFASELGQENIVRKHFEKQRSRTLERTLSQDHRVGRGKRPLSFKRLRKLKISAPYNAQRGTRRHSILDETAVQDLARPRRSRNAVLTPVGKQLSMAAILHRRKPRLILLKEEKDRFNAMRKIQRQTHKFKRWWALTLSVFAFSVLWLVGAIVFWQCEKTEQGLTYFQALYFAYVSLLTIGYGDLAPKSNPGRAFFVVWSLIAVPTMTILISAMSSTVVDGFKSAAAKAADFTVLPQRGALHDFLERHPRLSALLSTYKEKRELQKRQAQGLPYADLNDAEANALDTPGDGSAPTIEDLAYEADQDRLDVKSQDEGRLARRLATAIRNVSADLATNRARRYTFEEWVELTRLIRFTSDDAETALKKEDTKGMVEWDWIGEDSPMMSGISEPEFVLRRLCESLGRYVRRAERRKQKLEAFEQRAKSLDGSDDASATEPPLQSTITKEELFGDQHRSQSVRRVPRRSRSS